MNTALEACKAAVEWWGTTTVKITVPKQDPVETPLRSFDNEPRFIALARKAIADEDARNVKYEQAKQAWEDLKRKP